MSEWTAEALRHAALAALGPLGDARARDALMRATVTLALDVTVWQGSAGAVRGHRVTLGLDAAHRAAIAAAPSIEDAIRAALAAAVATRAGESLFELALAAQETGDLVDTPYRGRRPKR